MTEHVVASTDELPSGERILVQVEGREIGIFNVDGDFFAYTNWCAHQSGPCCEGTVTGTQSSTFDRETLEISLEYVKEGEILNCPWHGWEYDLITGECLSRGKVRLPGHEVRAEDGEIILTL